MKYDFDFILDRLYYKINKDGESLTVNSIREEEFYKIFDSPHYIDYYNAEYSGEITIPSNVEYNNKVYNVTNIGEYAFLKCKNLSGIILPNNLIIIGNNAFEDCTGLTSISVPENVTNIGSAAFAGCLALTKAEFASIESLFTINLGFSRLLDYAKHLYINGREITDIIIPNSVTSIGTSALKGCTSLTSVTIPNSVKDIGYAAFKGCSGLTSMTIPDFVKRIGNSSFKGCSGLTSVIMPDSVESIERCAFEDCIGLTSVTIPDRVTNISHKAFYGCSGLISVKIPDGVTKLETLRSLDVQI